MTQNNMKDNQICPHCNNNNPSCNDDGSSCYWKDINESKKNMRLKIYNERVKEIKEKWDLDYQINDKVRAVSVDSLNGRFMYYPSSGLLIIKSRRLHSNADPNKALKLIKSEIEKQSGKI